jgi:uncharacterized protein (TIGR01244 family)
MAYRWLAAALLALAGCATTPTAQAPATSVYLESAVRDEHLVIGAQPTALDLEALQRAGIRSVFNLRTDEEIAALDFDPATQADGLGLRYQHHPIGGAEHPYSPALLQAFAAEMAAADGHVLLHCASGGRAGQLYAAWLVEYRGLSPQQAMEKLKDFGSWPLPMERLLGKPLQVDYAPGGSNN